MKKLLFFLSVAIVLTIGIKTGLAAPGDAANEYGDTTIYNITVSKVEISQDNAAWHTVGEGAQAFNICDANVGAQVGNYMTATAIPAGTYRYVRHTMSRTLQIRGTSATYATTAATQAVLGGQMGLAQAVALGAATGTIVIPADAAEHPMGNETVEISGNNMIVTVTLNTPFTVTGSGGTLSIAFNTQNTIEFDVGFPGVIIFYPRPPSATITFD